MLPQSREKKAARDCAVHRDTCCIHKLNQKSKKIWHSASWYSRQVNNTVEKYKNEWWLGLQEEEIDAAAIKQATGWNMRHQ